MGTANSGKSGGRRPLLARLARDVSGNTLAIMAIALIPLSAMAGSAIDTARVYVVKARLQQACDAGVLAGRKFMEDSDDTTLDDVATTRAKTFFSNNFRDGWLGNHDSSFTPTKTPTRQVAGTATATVPMTVMKMFKAPEVTLNVTCEARFDVADTDVVFVLDTTGSMACLPTDSSSDCTNYVNNNPAQQYTRPSSDPSGYDDATAGYKGSTSYSVPENNSGSGSRIKALRQAVLDFWQTMADNIDPSTNVRYGFVTYTSTVNAGKAIMKASPSYLVGGLANESWQYQSRMVTNDYDTKTATSTTNSLSQASCTKTVTRTPAATGNQPYTYDPSSSTATIVTRDWATGTSKCTITTRTVGPVWTYKQMDQPVSDYVAGGSILDPTKVDNTKTAWDGCIEERATQAGATSFTSDSKDLDPDLIPSSDITTRWKPMWADVTYGRNQTIGYYQSGGKWYGYYYYNGTGQATTNGDNEGAAPSYSNNSKNQSGFVSCGKPIHRLSTMTKLQVSNYVNAADFAPLGGTYHDTGMIWGTRMLSPNGIFKDDTKAWPGRPTPKRIIVFLTDGDMAPSQTVYGLYGFEYFDRRVTGGDFANQTDYHNKRFLAECDRAKASPLKVDVWTVSIASSANTELTQCASNSAQALATTTGKGLSDAFKKIAKQVAMLRMSK